MTPDRRGSAIALWAELVAALKADDEAATRALIAPDFVIHEDESLPYGGVYHGPDGFMELSQTVWRMFGGSHFEPLYQLEDASGTRMCTVNTFTGTTKEGREVSAIINEVWTFRDGQATEARVWYYDAANVARAMRGD